MNAPTTINFVFERTTPGTARYMEVDDQGNKLKTSDGAKVGTLYVRKDALGSEIPQKLKVTLTPQ